MSKEIYLLMFQVKVISLNGGKYTSRSSCCLKMGKEVEIRNECQEHIIYTFIYK